MTPSPQQEETSSLDLVLDSPWFVITYVLGHLLAIISDVTMFSLALGSAAVGLATGSVWFGLATFFLVHTGIKIVNAITSATITSGRMQASAGHRLASVFEYANASRPEPSQDTTSE